MSKLKEMVKGMIGERLLHTLKKKLKNQVEEVFVIQQFYKKKNRKAVMLDVGVAWGQMSELFLKLGWKVYGFEPDGKKKALLREKFKDNPNYTLYEFALSDQPGELNFYTSPESEGISSLLNFHPTHELAEVVKVDTLNNVLERENIQGSTFLKVDVEGFDLMVLKGLDLNKHNSIEVIVCEFEDRKTEKLGYSCADMVAYLNSFGYKVIISEWEPIVKYGSSHKFRKASVYPCPIDSKAWGNVIAYKDPEFEQYVLNALN